MNRQQYRRGYLRGLGLGVVVTALIFCIASDNQNTLSDAEIRARALELGMVDGSNMTLADVKGNQQDSDSEKPTESAGTEVEAVPTGEADTPTTETQESEAASEATKESTEQSTETVENMVPSQPAVESTQQQESNADEDAEVKTITVVSGSGSYNVCVQLEEAGLIEDASAFDRYLINIGYSRYVNTGVYEIKVGTSEEEIAKIITRKQ